MSEHSWGKSEHTIVHESAPFNAEPAPAELAGRFVTPIEAFYSRNHGPVPDIAPDDWRLTIEGVPRPRTLTLADLREFERHELVATMQCAGARRAAMSEAREIDGEEPWGPGAVSTARWGGARLADVLRAAGVGEASDAAGVDEASAAGERHVCFQAPDVSEIPDPPEPYGGSIPLVKATRPEVLLAWEMNGEPLPQLHGGPVRVVVPGFIGARSVKWVTAITVQDEPSANHFQAIAYRIVPPEADPSSLPPGEGISLTASALIADVLTPEDGSRHPAGPLRVAGHAHAGERRVARVDVSLDEGRTWQQATLDDRGEPWAWTLWQIDVDLPRGQSTLVVRAWDDTGATQPEHPLSIWNPKGYANSAWGRLTVHGE